ncbi:MAG: hypothetical protein KDG44_09070, partial [Burkholderiaceae bacterium]|nr:hypothetical protein [Burkholderiaceae bacterium]
MDDMSAHTPGPWRITDRYGVLTDQVGIDGRTVCTVWVRQQGHRPSGVDTEPWPEGEANARLIAAAPELLDALRELAELVVLQFGMPPPGADGPLQKALAAIAKADGDTTW